MITRSADRWVILYGALATAIACRVPDESPFGGIQRSAINGLEEVASLDVAVDAARLHALVSARVPQQATATVLYAYSTDGGTTWSKPVTLSPSSDPPPIAGHGNEVQLAVHGLDLVAVWQTAGAVPGTGPMHVVFSRDGGATWHRGTNPAVGDLTNNQSYMDLAADEAGQFHLVWLDDRDENGNSQGLRYAHSADQGETWQSETTLDAAVCTCCWNRVAAIPGAGPVVLYRGQEPHDMRLARSEDGGHHWQPMPAVGDFGWQFSGCPHCGGALAVARQRDRTLLHSIVWTGKTGAAGLYFLSSSDRGTSWSVPQPIGSPRSRWADIAAADDELAAVIGDVSAQTAVVSFIRSHNGGENWSPPRQLADLADASRQPRIIATSNGFLAFWTEQDAAGRGILATAHLH